MRVNRVKGVILSVFIMLLLASCRKDSGEQTEGENGNPDATEQEEMTEDETEQEETEPEPEQEQTSITIEFKTEAKDYTAEDGTLIFSDSYTWPLVRIAGNEAAEAKINEDIEKERQRYKASAQEMAEMAKQDYEFSLTDGEMEFYPYGSGGRMTIERKDSIIISFSCLLWDYTGGAHGNYVTIGMNYDAASGERLDLTDVAEENGQFLKVAGEYLIDLAKSDSYKERLFENDEETIEETLFLDDKWYFSNSGITFFSDPYALGPFAAGTIRFVVPYNEIAGLKPEYAYEGNYEREIMPGTEVSRDLNGDGEEEVVYYHAEYGMETGEVLIELLVGGKDFSSDVEMISPDMEAYYLVDLNSSDKFTEIALMDYGPSDDFVTYFYRYLEDGSLKLLGSVSDLWSLGSCYLERDGFIAGNKRMELLQTWFAPAHWKMGDDGTISFYEEEMYYPGVDESVHNRILDTVTVYSDKDLDSTTVELTPADGTVQFTATDNKNWVEFRTEDNRTLYLYMENFSEIGFPGGRKDSAAVFDQLNYAD